MKTSTQFIGLKCGMSGLIGGIVGGLGVAMLLVSIPAAIVMFACGFALTAVSALSASTIDTLLSKSTETDQ